METADEDICRVCRSEGTPDKPLYHPCVCTGSIKFIHQECLVQWLKHSRKEYCELCKHRFAFTPIYSPDMPPRLPIQDICAGLLTSVGTAIRYWFHYTLVAFAWLGVVPLTACRIYKCLFTGSVSSLLTLPLDMLSTENLLADCLQGCFVVTCSLCAFISLVWLREQIVHGGPPLWLEHHQQPQPNAAGQQPNEAAGAGQGAADDPPAVPPAPAAPPAHNEAEPEPPDGLPEQGEEPELDNEEEGAAAEDADANNGAQDDMNWNALEWDRAAEELTWERMLGLDGSLVFLEHVFWVVSLNTLFILVFAFCPYHIGHFSVVGLGFEEYVQASHFEGLITTIVGYILLAMTLILCHGFAALVRFQRSRRLLGVCYIVVKVSLLVVVEIGVFPLICGWWLDICSLEMFDASLKDRELSFKSAPGTTMFLHWLVGMVYVFYFASFILLLREVLRPGVLWFLRNLNDPDFNPVQEMIHLPIYRHIRRFILSVVRTSTDTSAGSSCLWYVHLQTHPQVHPVCGMYIYRHIRRFILSGTYILRHIRRFILSVVRTSTDTSAGSSCLWYVHLQTHPQVHPVCGMYIYRHIRRFILSVVRTSTDTSAGSSCLWYVHLQTHPQVHPVCGTYIYRHIRRFILSVVRTSTDTSAGSSCLWYVHLQTHPQVHPVCGTYIYRHIRRFILSVVRTSTDTSAGSSCLWYVHLQTHPQVHPVCGTYIYRHIRRFILSVVRTSTDTSAGSSCLWYVHLQTHPQVHPVCGTYIYRHIRRFILSVVVFGSIVLLMLWLPIRMIKVFLPAFLPYNVLLYSDAPVSELSLELLLLQVVLPALLEQGHTRQWLKGLVRTWTVSAGYLLDLHSYLLGEQEDNEANQPVNNNNNPAPGHHNNNPAHVVGEGLHAAHQAILQQGGPIGFQPYQRPLRFPFRIVLLIGFMCVTLLVASLVCLTLPVFAGRWLMSFWTGSSKIHELYTAACGLYVCWLSIRGATVLLAWMPQGRTIIMIKVQEWTLMILKTLVVALLVAGVIPLLLGLLFELVIVAPLRVPLDQTPLFYPWQDWALGVLHAKIIAAITLMGPQWWLKSVIEQVYANGIRNIDLHFIIRKLAAPVISVLLLSLCVPYVIAAGVVPTVGVTPEMQILIQRRIYPFLLMVVSIIGILSFQIRQFKRLYEHIKNDKYLVGQRLVNYERKARGASSVPPPNPIPE
uniref:E3 ubiquitin-protein ligase MARCHF6 isoform X3 n=1 Tax=Oncorhynchus gorbuscha TaxID=8017 RepID=UPI001EAEA1F2|nr:E3 ubiquitin-protein ligase MARCHF6 isoform X3 [Oncorhynchus gorbuscha]